VKAVVNRSLKAKVTGLATACALRLANRHAAGCCRRAPSTCERWDLAGCPGRAEVQDRQHMLTRRRVSAYADVHGTRTRYRPKRRQHRS
jgi:hypothetical protein